jgi:Helix-turn-helix domain
VSWQAVTWVLEQSESTLGSRLVLLSIASHANREGKNAFPSLDTIAREALLSRREVIYAVQSMEELGELRVHRGIGRGNPNRYELPLVERWLEKVQRVHQLENGKGATRKLKGAIHDIKRCNDLVLKPKESETSTLQPLEPSKARTVIQKSLTSLCVPEPSKPLSQEKILQERDRQLTALREKGFIQ